MAKNPLEEARSSGKRCTTVKGHTGRAVLAPSPHASSYLHGYWEGLPPEQATTGGYNPV